MISGNGFHGGRRCCLDSRGLVCVLHGRVRVSVGRVMQLDALAAFEASGSADTAGAHHVSQPLTTGLSPPFLALGCTLVYPRDLFYLEAHSVMVFAPGTRLQAVHHATLISFQRGKNQKLDVEVLVWRRYRWKLLAFNWFGSCRWWLGSL